MYLQILASFSANEIITAASQVWISEVMQVKACAPKCSLNVRWKISTVRYHLHVRAEKVKPMKIESKWWLPVDGGGEVRVLVFKGINLQLLVYKP